MDLSSHSSQTSEQQLDLHGSTLQVYWYILTQPKKTFSYSEIQEVMGFSSKSSAIYQLEKLCELQILLKTRNGYIIVSRPKPRALQSYFFIKFILIPKPLTYGIMLSIINFSIFLLFNNGVDILPILLASIPNFGAIILFFSEAVLVWKNRPKPPHSNSILKSNGRKIKKTNKNHRLTNKKTDGKSRITRNTKQNQFLTHRIPLSKNKIRFLISIVIILFLACQIVLIGALLGFWKGSYTAQIHKNIEITFPEPLPIQLKRTGYTFQTRSLYALGEFRNGTSGIFLFQFEFNNDLNTLKAFNKHKFPSHIPSIGIGLTFNGNSFWAMEEWEDQTKSQRLFCFTKDMSSIQNYSLNIPSIVHSMNLEFSRRDIGVWNDSMWVLESWSEPNDDKLHTNVSIYSMKNFLPVKTFSVPIKADELFFDNHGQLWLSEFDYYPENQASFIAIAPNDGTILCTIRSFTFPRFSPPNQDGVSFFSYYPIIFNDSFLLPIGDDDISNLLGFQIISYELSPFPTIINFSWILLITTGLEGGIFTFLWFIYSKRKKLR
jgi:hypothetical protein